jgi:hypothetical protein
MKFLVYSLEYSWRAGGIVVLNKLAELLAQHGHETYILNGNPNSKSGAVTINLEQAKEIALDLKTVTIYPEVIVGNPLNSKKVARWVLFFPGFYGGEEKFADSEYVFSYNKAFVENTIYKNSLEIKILDTLINEIHDLGMARTRDVILLKKGTSNIRYRKWRYLRPMMKSLYDLESADNIINESKNVAEYNLELNKIRYFISYDNYSYHSILAALAGCISVVIPDIKKSRESFFDDYPERLSNVSYGFQDINSPRKPEVLREKLNRLELENIEYVRELVQEIEAFFD